MKETCGNCHWYYNCREHNFGDYCYGWMPESHGKVLEYKNDSILDYKNDSILNKKNDKTSNNEESYDLLIKDYLTKFRHCESCIANFYCYKNNYREPFNTDCCIKHIKEYLRNE